jgi:hypothetical protein
MRLPTGVVGRRSAVRTFVPLTSNVDQASNSAPSQGIEPCFVGLESTYCPAAEDIKVVVFCAYGALSRGLVALAQDLNP